MVRGQPFLCSFKEILRLSSFHKLGGKREYMRLILTMFFVVVSKYPEEVKKVRYVVHNSLILIF